MKTKRRDWWAITSTREHVGANLQKTYCSLNVAGRHDRPITVVATKKSNASDVTLQFVCLQCVSHECDHCLFVSDHVVQHRAGHVDAVGTRIISTDTPPHETFYPWPGEHFGKRLYQLPRVELHKLVAYYGAKKRADVPRYQELLAAAKATLEWQDARHDVEAFPAALRDDPSDTLPWEHDR